MVKCVVFKFYLFLFISFCPRADSITTYYPSPYGSYNELKTNKFVVGDTTLAAPDAGVIRFNGLAADPAAVAGGIYYNSTDAEFKYSDGTGWAALGGGGGCYINYDDFPNCVGNACCLTGFTNNGSLGGWGACLWAAPAYYSWFSPPGDNCGGAGKFTFGTAFLCCK